MNTNEPRPPKQPYRRPEMRQVTLRPEEAVLGACKTAAISGPGQPACTVPSACSAVGS